MKVKTTMFFSLAFVSLFLVYTSHTRVQKTPVDDNQIDLISFINDMQTRIQTIREVVSSLGEEKKSDPKTIELLEQTSKEIDEAEVKLKQLESVKDLPLEISTSLGIADITLKLIKNNQGRVHQYPEYCMGLTLDGKGRQEAQKDNLIEKTGIVETFGAANIWVLVVPNLDAPDGVDRYLLDEKVGLMGSSEPDSTLLVQERTPSNMRVTGLIDPISEKVKCVSQPKTVE